ncbi:hypothetical protein GQ457_02G027680 [Hibiscus cannabinus]
MHSMMALHSMMTCVFVNGFEHHSLSFQAYALFPTMQITSLVEARRQDDQGLNHLFKYIFVAMVVYVSNGEGMPCFGAC